MSSFARNCYPMAVQAVRDAISKDTVGETKEAYCCYLSSILFMIQALKDEAWEKQKMEDLCHEEAFKLYKLTEQSLGRAHDILKNATQKENTETHEVRKEKLSSSLSVPIAAKSKSLPSSPRRLTEVNSKSMKHLLSSLPAAPGLITSLPGSSGSALSGPAPRGPTPPPSVDDFITSLPTPPGYPATPARSSYQTQNYNMFQGYQCRKSKDKVVQKYTSCSNNMTMFREMAERKRLDDIKEKVYQEKMVIRQQEIKIEAERRWNQTNARSSRDKEYRQNLLETILSYEQDARWPVRQMRDTLAINREDTNVIGKVVHTILTYSGHPLCRVVKEIQYEIYSTIEPLVKEFSQPGSLSDDYYLVPVDSVAITSMSTLNQSEDGEVFENETPKSETLKVSDKTDSSTIYTFKDLEDDMFNSDSEEEGNNVADTGNYDTLTTKTDINNEAESTSIDNSDHDSYDQLSWTKSGRTYSDLGPGTQTPPNIVVCDDNIEEAYQDPSSQHRTAPPSNYEDLGAHQENIYEDVNEVVASIIRNERTSRSISPLTLKRLDSDFLKSTDRVVQDILFGIDRLHSVIILTYQTLDSPVGRDISYVNLESIFFKPLWPWLIRLFRRMNVDKEEALAEVMSNYKNCGPSKIDIRDKLTLEVGQESEPYLEAIEEMKQVVQFTSPLDKLECMVRVSKAICHCVEHYYNERGEKAPSIGCDDLLPLMSYVVLKGQLPQIVSECHAMTEFIHDGYLMGEEGYCLTTLHAAISNLLSLAKPQV